MTRSSTDTPEDLITIQPLLAESWDVSTMADLHVPPRPGAKFASGNPVTAEDVKFSHERLKNLKDIPGYYADPWVENITVIDPSTGFAGSEQADGLSAAAADGVPLSHRRLQADHRDGGNNNPDADQADTAKEWLDQHSAGSGPYVLSRGRRRPRFILERNPNYWRDSHRSSIV